MSELDKSYSKNGNMVIVMRPIIVEKQDSDKEEFVMPDSIASVLRVDMRLRGVRASMPNEDVINEAIRIGRAVGLKDMVSSRVYRENAPMNTDDNYHNYQIDLGTTELMRLEGIRASLIKTFSKQDKKIYAEVGKQNTAVDLEALTKEMDKNKDKPSH